MKHSDFIVITMKNSHSAFVQMESREFECSHNAAESLMVYARTNYALMGVIRNENGDVKYIFN